MRIRANGFGTQLAGTKLNMYHSLKLYVFVNRTSLRLLGRMVIVLGLIAEEWKEEEVKKNCFLLQHSSISILIEFSFGYVLFCCMWAALNKSNFKLLPESFSMVRCI